jgi:hypothetical protein
MKRIRRYSHRQALIDACRLIGYRIEPAAEKYGPYNTPKFQYIVLNPAGNVLRSPIEVASNNRQLTGQHVLTFQFMWQAALEALQREGVNVDALKPPRKAGDGSRTERAIPREGD